MPCKYNPGHDRIDLLHFIKQFETVHLAQLCETSFKVIISDVKMSKMDGLELLDKVHQINPIMTRIVLSGHANIELILKLVNAKGIDRYLLKPWENDDLVLAVKKCIELYDLRKTATRPAETI